MTSWFVRTEACETLASKLCAPCVRAGILSQVGFSSSLIERPMDAVAMSALARAIMAMRGLRWESWTDTGPGGRPPCTASSGGGSRQEPSPSSTMAMPTPSPSSGARRESRREHGGTSAKGPGEGDGGAWLSQESREALRVSAPERRGRWVRFGSREGGGPPAGRARTVIGSGARTATLVAPLRSDRLS